MVAPFFDSQCII